MPQNHTAPRPTCTHSNLSDFLRRRGKVGHDLTVAIAETKAGVPPMKAPERKAKTWHGNTGVVVKKGLRKEKPRTIQELRKAIARWIVIGPDRRSIDTDVVLIFRHGKRASGNELIA